MRVQAKQAIERLADVCCVPLNTAFRVFPRSSHVLVLAFVRTVSGSLR